MERDEWHELKLAPIPSAVRLLKSEPRTPPVALPDSIVLDVSKFTRVMLEQLKARLEGKDFLAGNWSLRELIRNLELVGMVVEMDCDRGGQVMHHVRLKGSAAHS